VVLYDSGNDVAGAVYEVFEGVAGKGNDDKVAGLFESGDDDEVRDVPRDLAPNFRGPAAPIGVNRGLDGTDWDCMEGESAGGEDGEARGCTTVGNPFDGNWGEESEFNILPQTSSPFSSPNESD